jgi:hypothetical protein
MPFGQWLSGLGRRLRPTPHRSGNSAERSCLLLLTHTWNDGIAAALAALDTTVGRRFDIHVLIDDTAGAAVPDLDGYRVHRFTADQITPADYGAKAAHHPGTIWPMNIELPVLWFFQRNPGYRRYWAMEYDVRFTGDWTRFFDVFEGNDAALLGTTLYRHAFRPGWMHWETLTAPVPVPEGERVRGLFPLYRLSHDALVRLDAAYCEGWGGHYEVAIPTVLTQAGMRIEDFGGDGELVATGNRNRFYRNTPINAGLAPGTFTVTPNTIDPASPPDLLWHPIKA